MAEVICTHCKHELKRVLCGNGWAHKKREHWTEHPHKAMPTMSAQPQFRDLLKMAGSDG